MPDSDEQPKDPNGPSNYDIAKEFTRQYYTILHRNSRMLYRFYGSESIIKREDIPLECDPTVELPDDDHDRIASGDSNPTAIKMLPTFRNQNNIREALSRIGFEKTECDVLTLDVVDTVGKKDTAALNIMITGSIRRAPGEPFRRFAQNFILRQGLSMRQWHIYADIFRFTAPAPVHVLPALDPSIIAGSTTSLNGPVEPMMTNLDNVGIPMHNNTAPILPGGICGTPSAAEAAAIEAVAAQSTNSLEMAPCNNFQTTHPDIQSSLPSHMPQPTPYEPPRQFLEENRMQVVRPEPIQNEPFPPEIVTGSVTEINDTHHTIREIAPPNIVPFNAPPTIPQEIHHPGPESTAGLEQPISVHPIHHEVEDHFSTEPMESMHDRVVPSPTIHSMVEPKRLTSSGAEILMEAPAGPDLVRPLDDRSNVMSPVLGPPAAAAPTKPATGFSWAKVAKKPGSLIGTNPPHKPASQGGQRAPARKDDEKKAPYGGGARSGFNKYPDSQQIFVGNLPNDLTDQSLREHFDGLGKIVEIRLNPQKFASESNRRRDQPAFAFIVFEQPQPVKEILNNKSKYLELKHHTGAVRINIEAKESKEKIDEQRAARRRSDRYNDRPNNYAPPQTSYVGLAGSVVKTPGDGDRSRRSNTSESRRSDSGSHGGGYAARTSNRYEGGFR